MSSTLWLADLPSNDLPSNEDSMSSASIELRPFQAGDATAFRELNEAWIRLHFGLEEHDKILVEGLRKVHDGSKIDVDFKQPKEILTKLEVPAE